MNQAYIIISDVHLGSTECNHKEFCNFLEWIIDLKNQPEVIKYKDEEITIKKPDKMILLGDILGIFAQRPIK